MFRQRLITALILIPLVLLAIEYASGWILTSILGIAVALAVFEWLSLIPVTQKLNQILLGIALVGCIAFSWFYFSMTLSIGLILWFLMTLAIITYPTSERMWGHPFWVALCCLIFLSVFFISMVHLYLIPRGKDLFIYALFLVWAADSGAYIVGKLWGKHRLIPKVSPGKTIEGAVGGLVTVWLVAGLGYFWFKPSSIGFWLGVASLVWLQAMVGDLFFSMLKRRVHLKDTGHLIPGHGGILDRLDSLIAVAPVFYVSLLWVQFL